MASTIGIVGCSAEGAALCYRTICTEAAALLGPHAHPPVAMHTASLADYVRCLDAGDLDGVAALMLDSARRVVAAGAELLVCPDNTIHQAFERVAPQAPRPWLHIADVVADEARSRGFRRVGLLGTRWLVASEVYPPRLAARGIECLRPDDAERDVLSALIMDELVAGLFRPEATARFAQAIAGFAARGCDAVVLGCTEIPLVIDEARSPLPTLDSTRLLARAALRAAIGTPAAATTPATAAAVPITCRPAREDDVAFLLQLRRAAMAPHLAAAGVHLGDAEQLSRVRAHFAFTEIVERGGRLVAMIKTVPEGGALRVLQLQVLPEAQCQGIGRTLLQRVIDRAAHGGRRVTLSVLKANPGARRLYERLGFAPVGEDGLNHHLARACSR